MNVPDPQKSLAENLTDLSVQLTTWGSTLVSVIGQLGDDQKLLRATLRTLAGALHYYARVARDAANAAR